MKISQTVTKLWVVQELFWKKISKGHNLETQKGSAIILVRNTLSLPNAHSFKIA